MKGFGRDADKSCVNMREIERTTDGTLAYVPTEPDNPKAVVRELSMLLTDGRLNDVARTVIEKAYVRVQDLLGREHALKSALKLLVLTAEFHSNKCVCCPLLGAQTRSCPCLPQLLCTHANICVFCIA